ncbi:Na+/H+ antiporter subunit E [Marinilabiliaceae bacterium ANBcel2]|nr:Na+/H+ antiporter subunit E [Marinilabiliaceae bacterium ANBcel2]
MRQIVFIIYLLLYFIYKVISAGWFVAIEVLKGSKGENGGIIKYNISLTGDWQKVILFNLISMTPGALAIDITDNNSVIEVHLLDIKKRDSFLTIAKNLETLISKIILNRAKHE